MVYGQITGELKPSGFGQLLKMKRIAYILTGGGFALLVGYFLWRLAKPLYIPLIASDDDINTLVWVYLATQILFASAGGLAGYWRFKRTRIEKR